MKRGLFLKYVTLFVGLVALVGVINASVDFGVFSFLYFYLGFPIIIANLISWLVAG